MALYGTAIVFRAHKHNMSADSGWTVLCEKENVCAKRYMQMC